MKREKGREKRQPIIKHNRFFLVNLIKPSKFAFENTHVFINKTRTRRPAACSCAVLLVVLCLYHSLSLSLFHRLCISAKGQTFDRSVKRNVSDRLPWGKSREGGAQFPLHSTLTPLSSIYGHCSLPDQVFFKERLCGKSSQLRKEVERRMEEWWK